MCLVSWILVRVCQAWIMGRKQWLNKTSSISIRKTAPLSPNLWRFSFMLMCSQYCFTPDCLSRLLFCIFKGICSYFICMEVWSACVYTTFTSSARVCNERTSSLLRMELQKVVNCHLDAGNYMQVLYKDSHLNHETIFPTPDWLIMDIKFPLLLNKMYSEIFPWLWSDLSYNTFLPSASSLMLLFSVWMLLLISQQSMLSLRINMEP